MKWSKDGRVYFNPENHTYWLGEKQLTGVTSYISKHKQPQNFDLIAEKYARKNNLIKEDVLAQWAEKGLKSRENGTKVHDLIEKWFNTKEIYPYLTAKEKVAEKFIKDFFLSGRLKPIECEFLVYSEKLGLASMIDMIAENKDGETFIIDWKTNESIKMDGWGRYMIEPYQMLPDADFYHFSLQVALYENMCKDYLIKESFIVHFGEQDYNILKPSKVFIHPPVKKR